MEFSPLSDASLLRIRSSGIFRSSVLFIDILLIFAVGISISAVFHLHKRQIFSKSTNYVLIADVIFISIHNLSYTIIQNWSLYRSIFWSGNVNDVMFTNEECWPHHVFNEFTKTTTLLVQFALIINRISVTINSQKFAKGGYGVALSILTLLASGALTIHQHLRGPLVGMKTTSCFRETDVVVDISTEHIIPYIAICSSSILCSLLLIVYVRMKKIKRAYELASQYMQRESMISTTAVAIIGSIQLATFACYDILLQVFATLSYKSPDEQDTNIIGWLYTGPFNAVVSPSAVLIYIFWIRKTRKKSIKSLTLQKDSDHFHQLSVIWNK